VSPKKGQPQARGIARRQQILDVAFELFATLGYRTATLAMVADRVGLTEAGVIHHFASKEALLLAVLEARDTAFPDTEAWVAAPGGGIGSLRRLPATAQVLVERPLLARFDVVVGGESVASGGPALDYFRRRMAAIRGTIGAMLTEGVARRELRADIDVAQRADEIVAFMAGIQLLWLLDPSVDLVGAYQHYVEGLEGELRSPARSRPARVRAHSRPSPT
jgi:AcrR family transcriptional regulator